MNGFTTIGMGQGSASRSGGSSNPFSDAIALIKNGIDPTKKAIFSAAGITAGQTRTYGLLDRDGILRDLFVNKPRGGVNSRYNEFNDNISASTTGALTINVIRVQDFDVEFPCTIGSLIAEITTGVAGNVRFGIWADNGDGYPGALLYDSGDLAIAAPGVKNPPVAIVLAPGKYYKGYITDTANTFRAIGAISKKAHIGYPVTLGVNTHGVCWSAAQAYGALPNPYPAGAAVVTIATLNNFPIIALIPS